jgi:hypothetical protein
MVLATHVKPKRGKNGRMANDSKTTSASNTSASIPTGDVVVPVPTVLWKHEPDDHDYPAALSYLGLICDPKTGKKIVDRLKKAPIILHPAKDILRSTGLQLLPISDFAVRRDLSKVLNGHQLSPVLILRGDFQRGIPATIADGYHRVCASYHLSENEQIPCRIVDGAI